MADIQEFCVGGVIVGRPPDVQLVVVVGPHLPHWTQRHHLAPSPYHLLCDKTNPRSASYAPLRDIYGVYSL
jgi:hypothetical protein